MKVRTWLCKLNTFKASALPVCWLCRGLFFQLFDVENPSNPKGQTKTLKANQPECVELHAFSKPSSKTEWPRPGSLFTSFELWSGRYSLCGSGFEAEIASSSYAAAAHGWYLCPAALQGLRSRKLKTHWQCQCPART